jgi:hypothetical protein
VARSPIDSEVLNQPAHCTELERRRFQLLPIAELEEMDLTVRFAVEGVFALDTPTVIGGAFKALKTSIGLDLLVSLATAKPFLGRFRVPEVVRGAYFIGEGGLQFARDVIRRICRARGVDPREVREATVCHDLPRLDQPIHLGEFRAALRRCKAAVVFLDPLYMQLGEAGSEASNVFSMGARLRELVDLCFDAGASPVVVHHFKRHLLRAEFVPPTLADLSQSGTAEFAGQWLLSGRRTAYSEENPGSHRLWLSLGGRTGHSALWCVDVEEGVLTGPDSRRWDVVVSDPAQARRTADEDAQRRRSDKRRQGRERKTDSIKEQIVDVLRSKSPTPQTLSDLRSLTGYETGELRPAVEELAGEGRVADDEVVKANRRTPYPAYKLVE